MGCRFLTSYIDCPFRGIRSKLAVNACLGRDCRCVGLVNKARSGRDVCARQHACVGGVQMQDDDRDVALQSLLLIDGVLHVTCVDQVDYCRRQVKTGKMDGGAHFCDGLGGSDTDVRASGQQRIDRRVSLQRRRGPRAMGRRLRARAGPTA